MKYVKMTKTDEVCIPSHYHRKISPILPKAAF